MWPMILLMSRLPGGVCRPVIGKARLPTVDSLLVGTTMRLVLTVTERSDRRLGSSRRRHA